MREAGGDCVYPDVECGTVVEMTLPLLARAAPAGAG
jgi:hypothetical protein